MVNNLLLYINDPKNPVYNFNLGLKYEQLGHTASAAGYYIRTAEFSEGRLLAYEALLRLALCLSKQGTRVFTVKGILLRAIALMPDRPEAYFLLARAYEHNKDWQEAYTWASIGEKKFIVDGCYGSGGCDYILPDEFKNLLTDVDYPGIEGFTFERAVAAWWIGLYDESLYLFRTLQKNNSLPEGYKKSINDNLTRLQDKWDDPLKYDKTLFERLKYKFEGSELIEENYSQCYQDMFVLTMLNGKTNGKYLEIGCGDPFHGNNTALLEKLGWSGVSIDIDLPTIEKWKGVRQNNVQCISSLRFDYNTLPHNRYDYLQIDCDASSLETLFKIPFHKCFFSVITFEHDDYKDPTGMVKLRSREYLKSHGYILVAGNVAPNNYNSFEDWYIHPKYVNEKTYKALQSDKVIRADKIFINLI